MVVAIYFTMAKSQIWITFLPVVHCITHNPPSSVSGRYCFIMSIMLVAFGMSMYGISKVKITLNGMLHEMLCKRRLGFCAMGKVYC